MEMKVIDYVVGIEESSYRICVSIVSSRGTSFSRVADITRGARTATELGMLLGAFYYFKALHHL
jgi:hypothetical protein